MQLSLYYTKVIIFLDRFVSTVVWYPEMQPEFNSTRLKLGPGEDTYQVVDQILVKEYDSYIKKRSQDFKNQSSTVSFYKTSFSARNVLATSIIILMHS